MFSTGWRRDQFFIKSMFGLQMQALRAPAGDLSTNLSPGSVDSCADVVGAAPLAPCITTGIFRA
jgi:hypothetical protein